MPSYFVRKVTRTPIFIRRTVRRGASFYISFLRDPRCCVLVRSARFCRLSIFKDVREFQACAPTLIPYGVTFIRRTLRNGLLLYTHFPTVVRGRSHIVNGRFFTHDRPCQGQRTVAHSVSRGSNFQYPAIRSSRSLTGKQPAHTIFQGAPSFLLVV